MAVLLETSLGELVVDLFPEKCPLTCKNFLKLCKIKYYNNCLFHNVQKDFIVQTGDPTGTGQGGDSIYKFLHGDQARFFDDEIDLKARHEKVGLLAMASLGKNLNASQFYITTRAHIDSLDGKHTIFGEVAEGLDTLMRINEAYVDGEGRPYKNIRIKHTHVLDDPFEDPPNLEKLIPPHSPELKPPAESEEIRLEDNWVPMDEGKDPEELEKELRKKEAQSRAVVLEMIGDLPDAEVKPPENVLFICRLNPVTQDEDLEIIFSRFGKIVSADVIRDIKTGDSLCYAFVEFENKESCEAAYFKMDNVLIDDRRIHVDFSQSVGRLWNRFRRFGSKDSAAQGGEDYGPKGKAQGCFNCQEFGHFARDCPNEKQEKGREKEEGEEASRPKFELKDTGGQVGGLDKSYGLVFEEDAEEDEPDGSKVRRAKQDRREEHGRATAHKQGRWERPPEREYRKVEREDRENREQERVRSRERHREGERDDAVYDERRGSREYRGEYRRGREGGEYERESYAREGSGRDVRRGERHDDSRNGRDRRTREDEDELAPAKRFRREDEGERERRRGHERDDLSRRRRDDYGDVARHGSQTRARGEDREGRRERYEEGSPSRRGRKD